MPELEARFVSPGRAFSAQALEETSFQTTLLSLTKPVLEQVRDDALSRNLFAAGAQALWYSAVDDAIVREGLNPNDDAVAALRAALRADDLAADAFTVAQSVLTAAAATYPGPSAEEMIQQLDDALGLTEDALTAAGHSRGARLNWRARVRRGVRTGFTGFAGLIALNSMRIAQRSEKMWVAHHDESTRASHLELDGTVVAVERPFLLTSGSMMYPGDPRGTYGEIVNCRCVIVSPR